MSDAFACVALLLVCLSNALHLTSCRPADDASERRDEIVLVEDALHYADLDAASTATLVTLDGAVVTDGQAYSGASGVTQNVDNEFTLDTSAAASDDFIFLTVKMPTHSQQHQQQQQQIEPLHPLVDIDKIDLLTVEDFSASSSSSSSSSSSCSSSCEAHDAGAEDADDADEAVPREIELRTDDLSSASASASAARLSIDMRDFVALIPADEVKSIVANYYRNDPEVQRAHAYLSGRAFAELKQRIIAVSEMSAFLRFLNASGLDVMGFFHALTNLTSKPAKSAGEQNGTDLASLPQESAADVSSVEFENISRTLTEESTTYQITTTTTITTTTPISGTKVETLSTTNTTTTTPTEATTSTATTSTTENLNGLHGLVDSILDVLPQDQILTTFFDKLETNEQFSKLVDNIGSPEFAQILHNMANSMALRNLVFTLHNNGIYITRIADSLKAYFFLGTF